MELIGPFHRIFFIRSNAATWTSAFVCSMSRNLQNGELEATGGKMHEAAIRIIHVAMWILAG